MSLVVGTNSWVNLTEANNYLQNRIDAQDWTLLTSAQKESYLLTSFWKIYNNKNYTIAKTSDNEFVKNAQIEYANWLVKYLTEIEKREMLQNAGVSSFSISKFSESFNGKINSMPSFIADMLDDFYVGGFETAVIEREND